MSVEPSPATGRAVPLWEGGPDTPIPTRVKLRIWEREGGRCYLSGRKIMPSDAFDYEHVKRLADGGLNREDNIRLALRDKHREKTSAENSAGAKADRIKAKRLGIHRSKSRGFDKRLRKRMDGSVVPREVRR